MPQTKSQFIIPSAPQLRDHPPAGTEWVHEVKFDGYRVQLHKHEDGVTIYSRNGKDLTHRFPAIAQAVRSTPAASVIIDGELIALDTQGHDDFGALHSGKFEQDALCVWCFDLLQHNTGDMRALPLITRKTKLADLLARAKGDWLRYSDVFTDATKLLAACDAHHLEGIVSKKKNAPYQSGKGDWVKVKSSSWREANRDRGDLFNNPRRPP